MTVDLKKEQQATLERPRYPYSTVARFFFRSMDVVAGGETTLAKAKVIEILAGVPYRYLAESRVHEDDRALPG